MTEKVQKALIIVNLHHEKIDVEVFSIQESSDVISIFNKAIPARKLVFGFSVPE